MSLSPRTPPGSPTNLPTDSNDFGALFLLAVNVQINVGLMNASNVQVAVLKRALMDIKNKHSARMHGDKLFHLTDLLLHNHIEYRPGNRITLHVEPVDMMEGADFFMTVFSDDSVFFSDGMDEYVQMA